MSEPHRVYIRQIGEETNAEIFVLSTRAHDIEHIGAMPIRLPWISRRRLDG